MLSVWSNYLLAIELFFRDGDSRYLMQLAISIRGLAYRYRGQEKPALDGVDLEVAEGEFVFVGLYRRDSRSRTSTVTL